MRKQKELRQEDLARKVNVSRSRIGAYEEGRAEPKLVTLQSLAHFFKVSLDDLLTKSLENNTENLADLHERGDNLRVLPVVVNDRNEELISLVPISAAAGYPQYMADPEFVERLPKFSLPVNEISANRTYRAFQIKGDSMKPLPSGAYILGEYVQNWREIRDGKCYVLITRNNGLLYKRVDNYIAEDRSLILRSDNLHYDAFSIPVEEVLEVWKAIGFLSFELPDPRHDNLSLQQLASSLTSLQQEVQDLKKV
ncbi:MAG: helix-turn-helix domain-containing protein [Bacteroidia bacterium]